MKPRISRPVRLARIQTPTQRWTRQSMPLLFEVCAILSQCVFSLQILFVFALSYLGLFFSYWNYGSQQYYSSIQKGDVGVVLFLQSLVFLVKNLEGDGELRKPLLFRCRDTSSLFLQRFLIPLASCRLLSFFRLWSRFSPAPKGIWSIYPFLVFCLGPGLDLPGNMHFSQNPLFPWYWPTCLIRSSPQLSTNSFAFCFSYNCIFSISITPLFECNVCFIHSLFSLAVPRRHSCGSPARGRRSNTSSGNTGSGTSSVLWSSSLSVCLWRCSSMPLR